MSSRSACSCCWIVLTLAVAALSGCVSVRYQRPATLIIPRTGETLVFGRIRFFHDGFEFFPYEASLVASPVATQTERHLWLLRLGKRAVSTELHPDSDGALAIWLYPGDYALLGSTYIQTSGAPPYEVIALFRVPIEPVAAYTGDLILNTKSHEGGHVSFSELGEKSVAVLPLDLARATLEQRLGALPEPPELWPWCIGDSLPAFHDANLASHAKELLDHSSCNVGSNAP